MPACLLTLRGECDSILVNESPEDGSGLTVTREEAQQRLALLPMADEPAGLRTHAASSRWRCLSACTPMVSRAHLSHSRVRAQPGASAPYAPMLSPCSLPGSNREIFGAKELYLTSQRVVRCLGKRPLNETPRKCCQMRLTAPPDVSDCHLTKHRLINSLGTFVNETRLSPESPQVVLPPKISPKLPVNAL